MTNAIMNPWIFYLMSVCSSLKIIAIMIAIIGWVLICIAAITIVVETCVDGAPHDTQPLIQPVKFALLLMIVVTLLAVLIPNETVLMQMTVASYVTPENISNAYQIVLDVTNDLLGIVNQ